jgi:hypothetical protein
MLLRTLRPTEHLFGTATRADKRQAAPFAKGQPKKPGRKPGKGQVG